jgi:LmbE family N-acetylglucosaminyl deacetylase
MSEGDRIPYEASRLPVSGAGRVLVLAPHPDDEVFGFGGCAALYAAQRIPVRALILTDGGAWGVPPEGVGIVEARRAEALRAAQLLGYEPPLFGPYADRALEHEAGLADFIVAQARATSSDVIAAPSPWEVHPDHFATAMAAVAAVARLGEACTLVQYEVGAALLPNVLVDITPVWTRKQAAMACFQSQLAMQRYDRHVSAQNVQRSYTLPAHVEVAEGLRVASAAEAGADPFGVVYRGRPHPVCGFIPRLQKPV